jgi:sugar phosphate isomerase/epimerase
MPINRRDFLTRTGLAGTSMLFSKPESLAAPVHAPSAAGYSLVVMATNWGFPGNAAAFCEKAKQEGYDGIEVWMPGDEKSRMEITEAAASNQLKLAFLYGGGDRDFRKHEEQFRSGITEAAKVRPLYINCHSGRDYFSFDQNRALMDFSLDLSAKTGIPVYHETHRARSLFAAHIARSFITQIPDLRLTFDVSHWCNVHESLLADQEESLALALSRTEHIHARIGHAEGPQVNDPRAPEWEAAVKAHFGWWDQVVQRKKKEGKIMTILTEFGPPDYLPTLPYTRQPLASQWDINVYMMKILRSRYGS